MEYSCTQASISAPFRERGRGTMYRHRHSESNSLSLPRVFAVLGLLLVLAVLAVMAAPVMPSSGEPLGMESSSLPKDHSSVIVEFDGASNPVPTRI